MSTRLIYFWGFFIVCLLLSTSIYLQLFQNVLPCPLCTLQRVAFGIIGLLFFIGFLFTKTCLRLSVNLFSFFITCCGIFFAGRQIWLQYFTKNIDGECEVSLQYMMQVLPFNEVVSKIFAGGAECAQRGYQFLSLTMAEWALISFILFLIVIFYLFVREISQKKR